MPLAQIPVSATQATRPRWRPGPVNLIDRRGAALALPILLAVAPNVAAVPGLAGIAASHAVYLRRTWEAS